MRKYEIIIYWSKEDGAFVAEVPEHHGCAAHGNSQHRHEDPRRNGLFCEDVFDRGTPPKVHLPALSADRRHLARTERQHGGDVWMSVF